MICHPQSSDTAQRQARSNHGKNRRGCHFLPIKREAISALREFSDSHKTIYNIQYNCDYCYHCKIKAAGIDGVGNTPGYDYYLMILPARIFRRATASPPNRLSPRRISLMDFSCILPDFEKNLSARQISSSSGVSGR